MKISTHELRAGALLVSLVSATFLMGASQCDQPPSPAEAGADTGVDTGVFGDSGSTGGGGGTTGGGTTGGGTGADCLQAANFPAVSADPANSAYPAPFVDAYCDGDSLVVESNGIPNYEFVPMTPNGLAAQDYVWEVPREPVYADTPADIPLLGVAGFAVNGLPIYGPNEAGFPDPYGDPVYNSIVDDCLGHTAQRGDYHYHALVVACVLDAYDAPPGEASPVIGYALDGFPIYGPRGCLDADCNEVVEFQSGYEQVGDPSTYAWEAHEYVPSSDPTVLDECNGRIGPDGTYRYYATEAFPYILGCYHGVTSGGTGADPTGGGTAAGGEPTGGDPTAGGALPTCDQVQRGMPCCGDGMCDGPETAANCAADC